MRNNRMDQFFKWLSEPMNAEDINTWYRANNIIPELSELFKDFSFSLYYIISETYLGDYHEGLYETKIGLTLQDKENHFKWCWDKTIDNFKKENITFKFSKSDYEYFYEFYFEVFYNQSDYQMREAIEDFLKQLFNNKRPLSKSDLEMFTDLYKTLERSLHI